VFGGPTDRADYLRDGRADVALLYAPFDDLTGLAHETLFVEERVAILPSGHRLASRDVLRLADLEHETMPSWQGALGGPDSGDGPEVVDLPQMIQLITVGRTVAILPRSLVQPVPSGLVCVPVIDAVTSRLVVAWSRQNRSPLIASFVASAVAACTAAPGAARAGISAATADSLAHS